MDIPRVVIIGGGLAGWGVVKELEPYARHEDIALTLIEERSCHEFPPLYYEVATGIAQGDTGEAVSLASSVCVDVVHLERFTRKANVAIVQDRVTAIHRAARRVVVLSGAEIPYDVLVLAMGVQTAYYGIMGLRDHAIPLKSVADALHIRRRICELIARARRGSVERFGIVIGGGGATGVEFAAELASACREFVRRGLLRREDVEITIVEGASRLLTAFPERASYLALRRLHRLGVRVFLDALVGKVTLDGVTVVPRPLREGEHREQLLCGFSGDSCELASDVTVWTGGIVPTALPKESGFAVNTRGAVVVDRTGLVEGERCVFALGDCAVFPDARGGTIPPLASHAVRSAPIVGENVMRMLRAARLRAYRARELPAILPLGGKYAMLTYRGRIVDGWSVWVLRSLVDLRYFTRAFGLVTGFSIWLRGIRAYVKND
ncbi:MAG: FAD-dependent oxidoreductase [bacterium]|nr:FAD-dependent oxidoreductase [bacterium]